MLYVNYNSIRKIETLTKELLHKLLFEIAVINIGDIEENFNV